MKLKIATIAVLMFPLSTLAQEKAPKAETKPPKAEAKTETKAEAKPPAMTAPKPGPELDVLKPIAATWSCDGKAPAGPMGPAHSYKSTVNNKWDLGNFWIWSEYQVKKSKENPMAFSAKGWIGWDSANKHYVWAGVDDTGGWISLTSKGWEGDKLVFDGDGMGMNGKTKMKFTITKGKTPNEITFEAASQSAKGDWEAPSSEACKKK
jgi:hypothetical protein